MSEVEYSVKYLIFEVFFLPNYCFYLSKHNNKYAVIIKERKKKKN